MLFELKSKLDSTLVPHPIPVPGVTTSKPGLVHHISAEKANALIGRQKGNPGFVILDIRTADEFQQGHIQGALNIDYYDWEFDALLDPLDRHNTYLLYCRSGARTMDALVLFDDLGFRTMYHMHRGIIDWQARGFQLTTSP